METIFKNLEIDYTIRYGCELLFNIERINGYIFDYHISFDLSRLGIQHKDDLKKYIVPEIKYLILKYWDDKLLIKEEPYEKL